MILSAEASNFSHLYLLFFDLVGITHTELRKFSSLKISKTSSPLCPYFFHMITKNVWTSLSKRDEQRFWNFLLLIFNNLRNKTGTNRPVSNIFSVRLYFHRICLRRFPLFPALVFLKKNRFAASHQRHANIPNRRLFVNKQHTGQPH